MNRAKKGANAEREFRKYLEGGGLMVLRSAGSKGPFDLIAFMPSQLVGEYGVPLAMATGYSVKSGSSMMLYRQRRQLSNLAKKYGIRACVVHRRSGKLAKEDLRWKVVPA